MQALQLLCVASAIGLCLAKVPFKEVEFKIFDDRIETFETNVYKSLQTTKNFFAEKEGAVILAGVEKAVSLVLAVGHLSTTVPILKEALSAESDWHIAFTKTIAQETEGVVTKNNIQWMESTLQSIQDKLPLLDEKTNKDIENRKATATILHTEIDKMINVFERDALFKKYPLLGAAPLIQLGLLVTVFNPLAYSLVPQVAVNPDICTKVQDVLLDYRPRAVMERFDRLSVDNKILFEVLLNVMSRPYNKYGYNESNADAIDCDKGCSKPYFLATAKCLKDSLNSDEYYVEDYSKPKCIYNYAELVRHRVESLFPTDLLESICTAVKERSPTGFGWFTIRITNVYAYGTADGSTCETNVNNACDPYLRLFVDGEKVLETPKRADTCCFDLRETYTSKKIRKTAKIKIEVYDDDTGVLFSFGDDLILRTEGTVDDFLKNGYRTGALIDSSRNAVETVSFWRDEYEAWTEHSADIDNTNVE